MMFHSLGCAISVVEIPSVHRRIFIAVEGNHRHFRYYLHSCAQWFLSNDLSPQFWISSIVVLIVSPQSTENLPILLMVSPKNTDVISPQYWTSSKVFDIPLIHYCTDIYQGDNSMLSVLFLFKYIYFRVDRQPVKIGSKSWWPASTRNQWDVKRIQAQLVEQILPTSISCPSTWYAHSW